VVDRLINQAVISRIAIAVQKLKRLAAVVGKSATRRQIMQSNNFSVSRKRFKPSMPPDAGVYHKHLATSARHN